MAAHAKLSPSGAARWMTCPGSVHLTATLPPQEGSSVYAARGTAIHSLSEMALKANTQPEDYLGQVVDGFTVDEDMAKISRIYVDIARETMGTKYYEIRVSLEDVIPDCFGTVDMVAMREGHLIICDLKTGAGVKVDVENNHQLMLYALGAYAKFSWLYDFSKVTMVIVQPPVSELPSSWTITVGELMAFADEVREAYRRIIEEPTTYVLSEKGCKWCRAAHICPEMQKLAAKAAATDFATESVEDIAAWLEKVPLLKQFIEAVESTAKDALMSGKPVPGWKVVEGRRSRVWKNEAEVIDALAEFKDKIFSRPELLSVAQMEKALKGQPVDLNDLIEVKTGQPTIAPESDKRAAITRDGTAAKDFAGIHQ